MYNEKLLGPGGLLPLGVWHALGAEWRAALLPGGQALAVGLLEPKELAGPAGHGDRCEHRELRGPAEHHGTRVTSPREGERGSHTHIYIYISKTYLNTSKGSMRRVIVR